MRITKGYNSMNLKKTDKIKEINLLDLSKDFFKKNVNITKGYVINLKKRQDRLNRFTNEVSKYLPDINISVFEAIDGSLLQDDEFYKKIVNKWNDYKISEKMSRGIIGCCLSHLNCYDLICKNNDDYVMIFEDDCSFISDDHKEIAQDYIKNLEIPEKFGIIFLNKCRSDPVKRIGQLYRISGAPTTEAYIINREYAEILYKEIINNIGPIDLHIRETMIKYPEYPSYQLVDGLFIQYDISDTNIQF
jgi:GR25 family glycosyltransferase involved in LPS biosynthesis